MVQDAGTKQDGDVDRLILQKLAEKADTFTNILNHVNDQLSEGKKLDHPKFFRRLSSLGSYGLILKTGENTKHPLYEITELGAASLNEPQNQESSPANDNLVPDTGITTREGAAAGLLDAKATKIIQSLGKTGRIEILNLMNQLTDNVSLNQVEQVGPAYFSEKTGIDKDVILDAVADLLRGGLLETNDDGNYKISEKGALFVKVMGDVAKAFFVGDDSGKKMEYRRYRPSEWREEEGQIILQTQKELMITTKSLSAIEKKDFKKFADDAFVYLKQKKVKVRIIATTRMKNAVLRRCVERYGAKVRFVPLKLLLKSPGAFRPMMLEDFCHVTISDSTHWLHINPHKREEQHAGEKCRNDPFRAKHLASIFESIWAIAKTSRKDVKRFTFLPQRE